MRILRFDEISDPAHEDFWVHELEAGLWRDYAGRVAGDPDLSESALPRWSQTLMPQYSRVVQFVAVEADVRLGHGCLEMPQRDNRSLAYVSVIVDEAHRGRGAGSAIYDEILHVALAEGRTIVQSWTYPGEVGEQFLFRRGFERMQIETMSAVRLAEQGALVRQAADAGREASPEYEVVQWVGASGELAADVAVLGRAMSTDVPTGGATLEEEAFDEERIRAGDAARARAGIVRVTTAVRHVPSGHLVGETSVSWFPDRPSMAAQWDTIVLREHRGHGLGWLIKTHSHAALRHHMPGVERVMTYNASDNEWMLAINRRLGYEPAASMGWYETRYDAA